MSLIKQLEETLDKDPMDFLDRADQVYQEKKDEDALAEGGHEQAILDGNEKDE